MEDFIVFFVVFGVPLSYLTFIFWYQGRRAERIAKAYFPNGCKTGGYRIDADRIQRVLHERGYGESEL